MKRSAKALAAIAAAMLAMGAAAANAATQTWNGTTGNWEDAARWGGTVPRDGDSAVVNSGSILLSGTTSNLASFTMNGGTLTFTNWTTVLVATNVIISNATVTLPAAFTNDVMSNRVRFVCGTFTLAAGAKIDVRARGYSGSAVYGGNGNGPGNGIGGGNYGPGAGHGGYGHVGGSGGTRGGIYDVTNAPQAPGSGGGAYGAGHGGGAVRIAASGRVTIDGTVDADGGNYTVYGGGGSGGSVFISCAAFVGAASAIMRVRGGNGGFYNQYSGGGGGGGRIAVAIGFSGADLQKLIDNETVSNLYVATNHPTFFGNCSVTGGVAVSGVDVRHPGGVGTLIFAQPILESSCQLTVKGQPANEGVPRPYPYGFYPSIASNLWVTNTVVSPLDLGGAVGRVCLGWTVTNAAGTVTASGSDTQAVFQMTGNLVLAYAWTNAYWLAVTSAVPAQGSVTPGPGEGWYTNGTAVSGILATPQAGNVFNRWTGTGVPAGQETVNPLAFGMTEPRFLVAHFATAGGTTKVWRGTGQWSSSTNWTPAGMPGPLDAAQIASGTATVKEPYEVKSLVVSNGAALLFTNWTARLTATDAIEVKGTVNLSGAFADAGMSNRVYFVCDTFKLAAGAKIDARAAGYRGSDIVGDNGHGPGKGIGGGNYGPGAGHGGYGHVGGSGGTRGGIYGVTNAPQAPGSGGGAYGAGHGGGAVRIAASGLVTIDGTVDADGGNYRVYGGGGSGGSILISCKRFKGAASGVMRANGGNGVEYQQYGSGGGGGGRIAVAIGFSGEVLQKLIANEPVRIVSELTTHPSYFGSVSVTGGVSAASGAYVFPGENGTIRFLVSPLSGTVIMIR
jgi:hypothetical protein